MHGERGQDDAQHPAHHVHAIQGSRHGNIFADTSSAANIIPGVLEFACRAVGAEKLLFGTDTPIYCNAMQRARIDSADLTDDEKSSSRIGRHSISH